ncbi:MAG: GntR family transcriptional regulator [Pseudomonadota bacterium]
MMDSYWQGKSLEAIADDKAINSIEFQKNGSAKAFSLSEQIANQIGERIIRGHYQPTERIMEQYLAEEFEISRGPIREALRVLESYGLVKIIPRRGAQVTKLSREEVQDIYEIRASLLGVAAKRISLRQPEETRGECSRMAAEIQQIATNTKDLNLYLNASFALTIWLTEMSGNARLSKLMHTLTLQTRRYTRIGFNSKQDCIQSAEVWGSLLGCIERGEGEMAEERAQALVLASLKRIVEQID